MVGNFLLNTIYSKLNDILKLSFIDIKLENKFQQSYLEKNITQNRLATTLALIANILYLIVVYIVNPEDLIISIKIVFFVVVPSGLLFLWLSTKKKFKDNILLYLFLVMIFVGSGAVLALYFTNGYYQLIYTIFVLPIIGIFLMSGAPFVISLLSALVLITAFIIAMFLIDLSSNHMIFVTFLISGTFLFSAISSYLTEKSNRDSFISKHEAIQANKAKSLFLANMSHEIRTPLNAIMGFLEILINKENDSEKIKYLKIIDNSSKSLLNIINDVLDLSKIDSGKFTTESVHFNPTSELKQTIQLYLPSAVQKNIQLILNIDDDIPEKLHSDILRIKQVLNNLLSNAIKFSNEGGIVTLKAHYYYDKEILSISVSDNGIGIAQDTQDKVFNTFTQSDNSITRRYGGTGLGLSISKKIINILGGDIIIESEENVGSTFIFKIPMSVSTEKNVLSDNSEEDLNDIQYDGQILIAEDNKTNQLLIEIILKEKGIKTYTVNDGLEAVDIVKTNKFDLILMDENMPNLNGLAAMKKIREYEVKNSLTRTPIISLTANAIQGDRERFLKSGMNGYLSKPINTTALNRYLKKYLKMQ